jgi:hypothetical protein
VVGALAFAAAATVLSSTYPRGAPTRPAREVPPAITVPACENTPTDPFEPFAASRHPGYVVADLSAKTVQTTALDVIDEALAPVPNTPDTGDRRSTGASTIATG